MTDFKTHLVNLCQKDSRWIKWLHEILLEGKCFWNVRISSDRSWIWRKILQIRNMAHKRIKIVVGNGKSTSLWFDNRHPLWPTGENVF